MPSVNNLLLTTGNIKNIVQGNFQKLLGLADKNPRIRVVFDIILIALPIIAMIALLLTSGAGGLMFFTIVPLIGFAGLGISLLISDTVKNKKVAQIAKKIAVFTIPLIILGSGIAFIAGGVLSIPTSAAFLGTPQFILGVIISGLALVAMKNITIPHIFQNNIASSTQQRSVSTTKAISNKNAASMKTTAFINQRKKNHLNQQRKNITRQNIARKKSFKYSTVKNISLKK